MMATAGHCKQAKCKVSVVSFGYKNGRAYTKPQRVLPQTDFVIPQHNGPSLPIAHIPSDQHTKPLAPSSQRTELKRHNRKKSKRKVFPGQIVYPWRALPPADGFLSLNIHLKPRLCWNLVTVCGSPKAIDKALSKIIFKALP